MLRTNVCTRVYGSYVSRRTAFGGAQRDPYKVLGVSRSATDAEIKEAYLKKCKELHPDVNKSPKAGIQFMEVRDAYTLIGKADNRSKVRAGEDMQKKSGLEEAMRAAMGKHSDWEPDFEKYDQKYKEHMLNRKHHRQQVFHEQFEMGKKANMDDFEEWEREHFDHLKSKKASEIYDQRRHVKMSKDEFEAKKRQIGFVLAISFALLLVQFMDVL